MEKGIKKTNQDIIMIGSKELAYVGDSIYEANIRKKLIENNIRGSKGLNEIAASYVSANAQAKIYTNLLNDNIFTNEEKEIAKRGRNTKQKNKPKAANMIEYKLATALECVFGFLYLGKDYSRIAFLIDTIFEKY